MKTMVPKIISGATFRRSIKRSSEKSPARYRVHAGFEAANSAIELAALIPTRPDLCNLAMQIDSCRRRKCVVSIAVVRARSSTAPNSHALNAVAHGSNIAVRACACSLALILKRADAEQGSS